MSDTPEPTDPDTNESDANDGELTASERAMPPEPGTLDDDPYMAAYEARLADQRASAIAAGRRKAGAAGAAMAGAMLAMRDIVDGPKKDDAPVTVEASGDPHDLERDGFGLTVGGVDVSAPPLDRKPPVVGRRKRR